MVLEATIEINPAFTFVHLSLSLVYLQQSEYEDALEEIQKEMKLQGSNNPPLECISGIIHVRMGKKDHAQEIFNDLKERAKTVLVAPYYLAALSISLGETDLGFELLDRAYEARSYWIREVMVDPLFESVHSDSGPIGIVVEHPIHEKYEVFHKRKSMDFIS